MKKAKRLEFMIKDENDKVLIGRQLIFPYFIDAEFIDREIAYIFLEEAERKKRNES